MRKELRSEIIKNHSAIQVPGLPVNASTSDIAAALIHLLGEDSKDNAGVVLCQRNEEIELAKSLENVEAVTSLRTFLSKCPLNRAPKFHASFRQTMDAYIDQFVQQQGKAPPTLAGAVGELVVRFREVIGSHWMSFAQVWVSVC